MMRTKKEGIRAADKAMASYARQARIFAKQRTELKQDRHAVVEELNQALEQLATRLIPAPTHDVLASVKAEFGFADLGTTLNKLHAKRDQLMDRAETIEADERFIRRIELTHQESGTYSIHIADQDEKLSVLRKDQRVFNNENFQWLYRRAIHIPKDPSLFQNFWRLVSLADYRESRAKDDCLQELNYSDFESCAAAYDRVKQHIRTEIRIRKAWFKKRQEILDLIQEREECLTFVGQFNQRALQQLRTQLTDTLSESDYSKIHRQLPAGSIHRITIAKCHALEKKIEYLRNLEVDIKKECDNRQDRIDSIRSVQRIWARSNQYYLREDKTKWLITIPRMKYKSTRKRIGWANSIHHNITSYDDYHKYNCLLSGAHSAHTGFLAYDAFGHKRENRMPYEGYTQGVLPDVKQHRSLYQQERADYSYYNDALAGAVIADALMTHQEQLNQDEQHAALDVEQAKQANEQAAERAEEQAADALAMNAHEVNQMDEFS